ncbi:ArgS-related anticodon-binding protein NrtL [Actinacidiphila guanduensis]|uniref:arginine--tRNA ligase n=1 Tax=Actinacidiphila guanduensis TaxID=310781 RepID=A0A1G9ZFZ3_9ACTN|nr:DALR anticodon-binding domain-containing protein [Actinacidiphila guanduensis]SDN20350.1 Arginyl tRNA synthetase N terminal domain-containing protein [Actinacidiphila guanduensis]
MTPSELSRAVLTTVRRAVDAAELAVEVPERVVIQRPARAGRGDYATNVALQLAGPAGRSPHEVAEILRRRLTREPGIAGVEIAGAGFLNITLSTLANSEVVRQVRAARWSYGRSDAMDDEKVTVVAQDGEPVRGVLVAEVVNRLLRAAGAAPAPAGTPPEVLTVAEPVLTDTEPYAVPAPTDPTATPPEGPTPPPYEGTRPEGPRAPLSEASTPPESSRAPLYEGTTPPNVSAAPLYGASTPPNVSAAPLYEGTTPPESPTAPPYGASTPPHTRTPPPYEGTYPNLLRLLGEPATRWALLRPPAEDTPRIATAADRAALLARREANPFFRVQYAHARAIALVQAARELGVDVDADIPDPRDTPQNGTVGGGRDASQNGTGVDTLPGGTVSNGRETRQDGTASNTGTTSPSTAAAPPAAGAPAPDSTPQPPAGTAAGTTEGTAAVLTLPPPGARRRGATAPPAYHPAETELLGLVADFPRVVESAARRRAPDRVARHLERLADAFARFHDECHPLPKGDEKPSAVHAARIRLADAAAVVLADGLALLGIAAPERI